MAPAVYVRKKSGELRLCVDYRELNKRTQRDAYPLPLPDEVQDRLADSTIFSTLDLQCGYWQVPVNPSDVPKTAFCPGPGMGLFQFRRMPFGLTGAPSSFQRLMDKILRSLPFVSTYIDDVLIHSSTVQQHQKHLQAVFQRLKNAGLTLRGRKCHIGMSQVCYLGHVFSATGMTPDQRKVHAVAAWPVPDNATAVRRFLGLASYYRRYISHFADIAKPLHNLTQKNTPFDWTKECDETFHALKQKLVQAPILTYPKFHSTASILVLQTDASSTGLGAVLEQDSHVVAYASRALTQPEQNYSVIQKECLAVIYAVKQFRHYLLGRKFKLVTDHAPLQWLSAQKMQGLLCRWALALQEYDFDIVHRKGSVNTNADALSRRSYSTQVAATQATSDVVKAEIREAQIDDPVTNHILHALSTSTQRPTRKQWYHPPLRHYRRIWSQLTILDGVACRQYKPGPLSESVSVPVLPPSLRCRALHCAHNVPSAGHQGMSKTLERLQQEAYWVGMAGDVERHCRTCITCQQSKLPAPTRAPMTSIPIGRPWQMVAVDVLEVPLSYHHNRYLLVVQDYFTKWPEAIPLPDQKASRITNELVKLFSRLGPPDILHSDQGRNFESAILQQTLQAFGLNKSRTTAYHPQCDGMVERLNRSLLQLLRSYVTKEEDWERYLPLVLYAYRTAPHSSTGVSPFMLMFGRKPKSADFSHSLAFDPSSYQAHLQSKLAQLHDMVEANTTAAAHSQKTTYDRHTSHRTFKVGDPVWLSIPTAGKLEPRWEGEWTVKEVKSDVNVKIGKDGKLKVVHVNRLQPQVQPGPNARECTTTAEQAPVHQQTWNPPQIEHLVIPSETVPPARRYPTRERRPPDRLQL